MKKSIENKLKAIVVPSGGSVKEDLERAQAAINYNGNDLPYIITGLGPDTNNGMETNNPDLDYHQDLHNYLLINTSQKIGTEINSTNSIENIKNTFPNGAQGRYAIVSYPLHLERFKLIVEDLKSKGDLSENLELIYLPTKQSFKQKAYGKLALLKQKIS